MYTGGEVVSYPHLYQLLPFHPPTTHPLSLPLSLTSTRLKEDTTSYVEMHPFSSNRNTTTMNNHTNASLDTELWGYSMVYIQHCKVILLYC